MEALFGIGFWDHVTLGVSHWKYDISSVIERNHTGKNEAWWIEDKNKQLQARFVLEKDLDVVFIDSWSQQSWNLEDELQQVAFKRETKKLWDLFSVMDNFAFKTIQDVIEELYECNQLLDGSIEQLQKDMEDRVAEINLLNDHTLQLDQAVTVNKNQTEVNRGLIITNQEDVRNFGIIAAKNRHNILVNGDMIQKNEDNIEANGGLIQTNKDDIEVNAGLIQANKDDIEVNAGLIVSNKEQIESNLGIIEDNLNSINVS